MLSWLRHILICSIALAGCFASERAEAAFLAPQLEVVMSGPAETYETPHEAPRPRWVDAVTAASASMTGVGLGTTGNGGTGHVIYSTDSATSDRPLFVSRLKLALERVEACQGFLLDILRPPKI